MNTKRFTQIPLLLLSFVLLLFFVGTAAGEISPNPGLGITANIIPGYAPAYALSFTTNDPNVNPGRLYGWKDGNYGGLYLESQVGSAFSQIRINTHDGHQYNSTIVLDSKLAAVTQFLRVNKGIGIGTGAEPTQDLTLQIKERSTPPTPAAGAILIYSRNGAVYVMFPNGVEKLLADNVAQQTGKK